MSRPSIEYGRGFSRGVTDPIISAVMDAAINLIKNNQASVSDVVTVLEQRKWRLFQRIALHILRLFSDRGPDLVAQKLKNPVSHDHSGSVREFWLLAESQFKTLSPADKQPLLDWIGAGPDLKAFRRRWEEFTGQPVTEENAISMAGGGDATDWRY